MMSPTPSLPPSIMGETKATESAIDAYANKVLETMSPPETSFIDDNLGPYVTSLLRCADIQDKGQVTTLEEFDSLLELLEDQCNMDKKKASDCVLLIADAVVTHILPFSERTIITRGRRSNSFGLYPQEGGLDSFRSMKSHLPESITAAASSLTAAATLNAGGPSPIKPDNLIPIDLMGELDDPSPNYYSTSPSTSALHVQMQMQMQMQQHYPKTQTQTKHRDIYAHEAKQSSQNNASSQNKNKNDNFPPLGTSPEAFPPLGASIEKPKKVKIGSSKKSSHGKTQQHSDKDLAATLFRPARPRQNSIESEDAASSHQQRSRGSSNASASMTMTSTIDEGGACSNNNIYFQQQLHSCVEILLSMNQELSEEAASAAGLMANTDFNLAQHIVDSAMTAPPICRHMLHEGCYRSDCTFSHDVDGHTCLFWLRGRCGKGNSCKFFHGFHEKLLNGIDTSQCHAQQSNHGNIQSNMAPSSGYHQYSHTGPPSASPSSSMVGAFGTSSPLLSSSWQTPSLLEGASSGPGKPNNSSAAETPFSFANIASKGYEKNKFSEAVSSPSFSKSSGVTLSTVRIPQDLWNPHENRDSSVFHLKDPLERYQQVASSVQRSDVIDLHFQSIKTFPIVLEKNLPLKLSSEMNRQVWIVTGTGHHVGTKTHQKGGGALELAVIQWLVDENYNFSRGKDRNGLGGALLVNR